MGIITPITQAQVQPVVTGPWTPIVRGAKVESGGLQANEARSEGAGTTARVRGAFKIKAAETLEIGETLFTTPIHPVADIEFERVTSAGKLLRVKIAAATGICTSTEKILAGEIVFFDDFTYNIT